MTSPRPDRAGLFGSSVGANGRARPSRTRAGPASPAAPASGAANPAGATVRYETRMRARVGPVERDSATMQALVLSPTARDDVVRFVTPADDRP